MEKAKQYLKEHRVRSMVGDVKNEDVQVAMEIAYLEGYLYGAEEHFRDSSWPDNRDTLKMRHMMRRLNELTQ